MGQRIVAMRNRLIHAYYSVHTSISFGRLYKKTFLR